MLIQKDWQCRIEFLPSDQWDEISPYIWACHEGFSEIGLKRAAQLKDDEIFQAYMNPNKVVSEYFSEREAFVIMDSAYYWEEDKENHAIVCYYPPYPFQLIFTPCINADFESIRVREIASHSLRQVLGYKWPDHVYVGSKFKDLNIKEYNSRIPSVFAWIKSKVKR